MTLTTSQLKKGLFSSQCLTWQTPDAVYQDLHNEFNFDFDPCPPNPQFDGLTCEWGLRNFVNPPYGKEIINWFDKAELERTKGKTSVFLVPSRTDTKWWYRYVIKADEVRFIRGRLRFKGARDNAPFPSCIIIFKGANV